MTKIIHEASSFVARFGADENGTQLVETAVWIGLITALVVATVGLVGGHVDTAFTTLETNMRPISN